MTDEGPVAARGPARRVIALVGVVIAAVGLVFVVRAVGRNWDEVRDALRTASVGWLILAFPVALAAMATIGAGWRRAIRLVGAERPLGEVLRWYFVGQLGKYVPGALWAVVGRAELAASGGLGRTAAYTSTGLSMVATYLAAGLVAVVTLPLAIAGGGELDEALWALLFVPAGLLVLHPAVLSWLVRSGERVFGDGRHAVVPRWWPTVRLVLSLLPSWLLIGTATWLVTRGLDPSAPFAPVLFAAALSWLVGFVVVPVPGGLGVREATFTALAATVVPVGVAAAAALVARVLFMVVDVTGAALVTVPRQARRRARPAPADPARR